MNKYIVEVKNGRKYELVRTCSDPLTVYQELTHDLISKKMCNAQYIRSIRRVQNYNGTISIIVNYDNNVRRTYTIYEK